MPRAAQRHRAVSLSSAALVAGLAVVAALAGCSGSSHAKRTTPVAPSFSLISTGPSPSSSPTSSPPGSASASITTGVGDDPTTAPSAPIQPAPPTVTPTGTSAVPCPLPSPQNLVEGESAKAAAGGQITFGYLAAQRMCGPAGAVTFVVTTKVTTSATVDPSATVFLLPPGGNGDLLQIPAAAFPDALKATPKPVYFAITYGAPAGLVEQIVQYPAPHS